MLMRNLWRRLKFRWLLARPQTRWKIVSAVCAICVLSCWLNYQSVSYRSHLPAIVCLRVIFGDAPKLEDPRNDVRFGTGVLIAEGGQVYVLSVGHIATVEPFPSVFGVVLPVPTPTPRCELRLAKDRYTPVDLLRVDEKRDLSLYRVRDAAVAKQLRKRALAGFKQLAHNKEPRYGSELYVIGFAFGPCFPHHLQVGHQAQTRPKDIGEFRRPPPWTDISALDGVLHCGMSGSPVMTARGRIVGLAAGTYNEAISFYVPARSIKTFLVEWKQSSGRTKNVLPDVKK